MVDRNFLVYFLGVLLTVNGFFIKQSFETLDKLTMTVNEHSVKIAVVENELQAINKRYTKS